MTADDLVTVDYSIDPHELYFSMDENLLVREIHFRTPHGLSHEGLMKFLVEAFRVNRESALKTMTSFLERRERER